MILYNYEKNLIPMSLNNKALMFILINLFVLHLYNRFFTNHRSMYRDCGL